MSLPLARGLVFGLAVAAGFIGDGCVMTPPPAHHEALELEGPSRVVIRGAPVVLEEDEVEDGNLVVLGGSARIDGTVRGSLLVFGGWLEVGPEARVERDLVAVGNEHQEVAPGAQVAGSEVVADVPGAASLVASLLSAWDYPLLAVLVGLATLGLLGWLAWRRVVRGYDDARFHGALSDRPVRAGLIGLGLHVGAWGLGLALLLTGWLSGAGLALWFAGWMAWLVGWVVCGAHAGRWLARRRGWGGSAAGHALVGVTLWLLVSLVPVVGWLAALLGSLVGFGALVSSRGGLPGTSTAAAVPEPLPAPAG